MTSTFDRYGSRDDAHDQHDAICVEWFDGRVGGAYCICKALRTCEQRVLEDEFSYKGDIDTAYGQGWDEALDAAREAVASMVIETVGNSAATVDQALAAIDALRGEQA